MFDIENLLSFDNKKDAFEAFRLKRDGSGPDGLRISELEDYWKANGDRIEQSIRNGTYKPSIAKVFEITGGTGKRREIASINVADRFVERLLQQQFRKDIEPCFLARSFAYQQGKGTLDAAMLARDYIAEGNTWLCEIDIQDFFGTLNLDNALSFLKSYLEDDRVLTLVDSILHREIERDGAITQIKKGLVQGSSISPFIANMYLHPLDLHLDSLGYKWLRYADNIYVFSQLRKDAEIAFEIIHGRLTIHHQLAINKKKSGIYSAIDRRILGYHFSYQNGGVEVRKHHYQPQSHFHTWHASTVHRDNGAYHIVQDGIINKKDYSLLFENDDERHHIPVETTDQINVYGSVTVSPSAMRTLSNRNIRISYFDDFGRLMGTYTPVTHGKAAHVFLEQCNLYADEKARFQAALDFELSSIHNMRAILKYYKKKGLDLEQMISSLTELMNEAKTCKNVDSLMLVEARARRDYYSGFSAIVAAAGFGFDQRSKQPPKDECNALISFGGTVLYNTILQMIWKTSLDPKIGVVHATNRRDYSLNLDFADVFKPIIVDRAIFSVVNRREIKKQHHFREAEDGGIMLNDVGKRLFLDCLEKKLDASFLRGRKRITYRQLIADEIYAFQRMLVKGESYRPYKYY